jgi:hypothetical protein
MYRLVHNVGCTYTSEDIEVMHQRVLDSLNYYWRKKGPQ